MSYANPLTFRPKVHATEFRAPGQSSRLVGSDGNINASDRSDLMKQIGHLLTAMADGTVMQKDEQSVTAKSAIIKQKNEAVIAAYKSDDSRTFKEMGSALSSQLYETANRQGFMRRFLKRAELNQGGIPRIPVSYKTSFAWAASSEASIEATHVRNKYLMPPEFYIQAYVIIGEREIAQSTGDLLEEKLMEAQEAVMVREDKIFMRLVNRVAGQQNPLLTIMGGLTPQNLGLMRTQILQWNLPPQTLLFSADVWQDISTNTAFGAFYDPVSQYEIVQTGVLGRLLGMDIISDAYRVPQQKVLNQGDIYVFTQPDYLGGYTDRGPVTANEVNASAVGLGYPGRGWDLWETLSMALVGGRGISYAKRTA